MPHVAAWNVFCSTSALGIRFQVGLLGAFDEGGVRLGIFDEGGDGFPKLNLVMKDKPIKNSTSDKVTKRNQQ